MSPTQPSCGPTNVPSCGPTHPMGPTHAGPSTHPDPLLSTPALVSDAAARRVGERRLSHVTPDLSSSGSQVRGSPENPPEPAPAPTKRPRPAQLSFAMAFGTPPGSCASLPALNPTLSFNELSSLDACAGASMCNAVRGLSSPHFELITPPPLPYGSPALRDAANCLAPIRRREHATCAIDCPEVAHSGSAAGAGGDADTQAQYRLKCVPALSSRAHPLPAAPRDLRSLLARRLLVARNEALASTKQQAPAARSGS